MSVMPHFQRMFHFSSVVFAGSWLSVCTIFAIYEKWATLSWQLMHERYLWENTPSKLKKRNVILRSDVHSTLRFFFILLLQRWKINCFSSALCFQSFQFTFADWKQFVQEEMTRSCCQFVEKAFDTFIENRSFVFMSFSTLKWHCSMNSVRYLTWLTLVLRVSGNEDSRHFHEKSTRFITHFFIKLSSHYESVIFWVQSTWKLNATHGIISMEIRQLKTFFVIYWSDYMTKIS